MAQIGTGNIDWVFAATHSGARLVRPVFARILDTPSPRWVLTVTARPAPGPGRKSLTPMANVFLVRVAKIRAVLARWNARNKLRRSVIPARPVRGNPTIDLRVGDISRSPSRD